MRGRKFYFNFFSSISALNLLRSTAIAGNGSGVNAPKGSFHFIK